MTLMLNLPRWQVTENGLERKLGVYGRCPDRTVLRRQIAQSLRLIETPHRRYYQRLSRTLCHSLGITRLHLRAHHLAAHPEASWLQQFPNDSARAIWLEPRALQAAQAMISAAQTDGVSLRVISGFRGYARQTELIRQKLARGQTLTEILKVSAAPGHSEHHSGRAIDFSEAGETALDEVFASTAAYQWLRASAGRFGFRLSYPEHNPNAIAFEPWHWFWLG